jgi:hypothetical protein
LPSALRASLRNRLDIFCHDHKYNNQEASDAADVKIHKVTLFCVSCI